MELMAGSAIEVPVYVFPNIGEEKINVPHFPLQGDIIRISGEG